MTSLPLSNSADGLASLGDFTLSEDDLAELRSALIADCPQASPLSDDDIRRMAYDTIQFVALIIALKQTRVG